MGFELFDNDIKMGLKSVYLLYGHEKYLIEQYLDKMIEKYVDESYRDFNLTVYDGEKIELDEIIDTCETIPFFSDLKIVIVKNVPYFKGNKKVLSDSEEARLIDYIKSPSETTRLIMVSNNGPDSRKKITKAIKKDGSAIEFEKLKSNVFFKWVHRKIKSNKKDIGVEELRYLIDRLSYLDKNSKKNLLDVNNELQMVCSSLIDREFVEKKDINNFIKKPIDADIFKMVDAVGRKKAETAITLMDQLLISGEPIQVIFSMICRQFRLIKKIKMLTLEGYNQGSIVKLLKLHPYVVKTITNQINMFDNKTLSSILDKCSKIDYMMKSTSIDSRLAVETLIVECSLLI